MATTMHVGDMAERLRDARTHFNLSPAVRAEVLPDGVCAQVETAALRALRAEGAKPSPGAHVVAP